MVGRVSMTYVWTPATSLRVQAIGATGPRPASVEMLFVGLAGREITA
jgi:hypothetical protein